jgi:hypothetical protein
VKSRGFRKVQWSHGVSGKHSGVTGFQENTVESRGFSKAQWIHGVSGKYSGVMGFQVRRTSVVSGKYGRVTVNQVIVGE